MKAYEVNFDGIVGPTHNYSGLSYGNVASLKFKKNISNPKKAALQGLAKMKFLMDLGIKQALLPPHERPHIPTLKQLGFTGTCEEIIRQSFDTSPEIFFSCCSSSNMWTANAATLCPSSDSGDGLCHITPANLSSKLHRSIEAPFTAKLLQKVFPNPQYFRHHDPLISGEMFADEGAANHTRFCKTQEEKGVHLFVYGRKSLASDRQLPKLYPARQTMEASQAIVRLHQLNTNQVVLAKQNPLAIDAGVFHNDVISVGHQHLFFYHELAFEETSSIIDEIHKKISVTCDIEPILVKVSKAAIPLETAVDTYLFNSQILTLPNGEFIMLAPIECQENAAVGTFLEDMVRSPSNPISKVHFCDIRESMQNGGGPACLRLRVVLNEKELNAAHKGVFLTEDLYHKLTHWVERHYRDELSPSELRDPQLYYDSQKALDELTQLLGLGSLYSFQ